jgi:hypothetical protein
MIWRMAIAALTLILGFMVVEGAFSWAYDHESVHIVPARVVPTHGTVWTDPWSTTQSAAP